MKHEFVLLMMILTPLCCTGQISVIDDFSDGNLTESPSWIGDTANFTVNSDHQIQLNAPELKDQSYISTPCEAAVEAEWSYYIKLDFNPSSNNYADIYLVSDRENLTGPLNGYFVRIGNTQDEVSLYKQSGEKSTAEKIIDGTDKKLDLSQAELSIKVTKSQENEWELFADYELNGNYISEGTVTDGAHKFSGFFGIVCTYTSTRSDKFYFDNIRITGKPFIDETKPSVVSSVVTTDSTVLITFSEKTESETAANSDNYKVDGGIGLPSVILVENDSTVMLVFEIKFKDKQSYLLHIHNVRDLFGNVAEDTSVSFTYFAPYLVKFNDILITEIMADPNPGVDLPEYEFLEIFNPSERDYSVDQLKLLAGNDTVMIPDFEISGGEYIILCSSAATEHLEKFGKTLKISNWPSLNNRGESLTLLNKKGMVIFHISYDDSWYQSIDKDDGGWSLEMTDSDFPCKSRENWSASGDPSGGTPGRNNSSSDKLTDLTDPTINNIIADSESAITVYLSENIGYQPLTVQQISGTSGLAAKSASLSTPDFSKVHIGFEQDFLPNRPYVISISNLRDCVGNIQKKTSGEFVLPAVADSLDVIINEIMFNPPPDGTDFVEIYNRSDKYIDLISCQIANGDDIEIITEAHFILKPKKFLVICEDAEILMNQYPYIDPNSLKEIDDLPALNDDEGEAALLRADGKVLDYFQYSDDFHSEFLRETEGVSLERISFDGGSNNSDNWHSASATSGFATPGKMNSQFREGNSAMTEVMIDPPVFVPGNGGQNDFTTIKCRFEKPGNMGDIKILDRSGRLIKTIISNQSLAAEEDFKWEGTDDTGRRVRMGPYIVFLEIYHSDGSKKRIRKKVVVGTKM